MSLSFMSGPYTSSLAHPRVARLADNIYLIAKITIVVSTVILKADN